MFQVFVEDEVHVWMMALVPSLQDMWKEGRNEQLVFEEVVGESFQVSGETLEVHEPVEMIIGNDHIFRIPGDVHDLHRNTSPT